MGQRDRQTENVKDLRRIGKRYRQTEGDERQTDRTIHQTKANGI